MGHTLFVGVTESGKTTMARHFARGYAALGHRIIVYDPVGTKTAGGGWPASAVMFSEVEPLFEYLERDDVNHAHVFIDEAGDFMGVSDKDKHWLLRRGRHKGFFVNIISQRPKMLAPNVRTQCNVAYMFRLSMNDADEIGADFGHSKLSNIVSKLDKGEYLRLESGSPHIKRGSLFKQLSKGNENGIR